MNKFIVNIGNENLEIIQDDDGKFIKPEFIKELDSFGTALKPAIEPIVLARKPLSEKTVALNVLKWGVGGLNIDGCRIKLENGEDTSIIAHRKANEHIYKLGFKKHDNEFPDYNSQGRFPANFIHDGSDEVVRLFPNVKTGSIKRGSIVNSEHDSQSMSGKLNPFIIEREIVGDSGSASRFFYTAKADKGERDMWLEGFRKATPGEMTDRKDGSDGLNSPRAGAGRVSGARNVHPTVKPIDLMEYLIKLITPPNGTVLDPFLGSGTTMIACKHLRRSCIGIEKDPEYCKIAKGRMFVNPLIKDSFEFKVVS